MKDQDLQNSMQAGQDSVSANTLGNAQTTAGVGTTWDSYIVGTGFGVGNALNFNEGKIRPLSIEELNYGYVVTVGCHKFAISSSKKLTKLIGEYLEDPKSTEEKWFNNSLSIKKDKVKKDA